MHMHSACAVHTRSASSVPGHVASLVIPLVDWVYGSACCTRFHGDRARNNILSEWLVPTSHPSQRVDMHRWSARQ